MVVTKVHYKNYGIHRDLTFKPGPVPIVGLLGPNGSGKSTILGGLNFAFNAHLPQTTDTLDNMVTYGEEKGHVDVDFQLNGKQGSILRTVGKNATRRLKWDGETIKSGSGVTEKFLEILGVDRDAMKNACFIKQGALNELLFGTEAERERLAIKLVNLTFCDKHRDKIEQRIKIYGNAIGDFSTLVSEQEDRLEEAIAVCMELKQSLNASTNYQETITKHRAYLAAEQEEQRLNSQLSRHNTTRVTYQASCAQVLKGFNVEDVKQLETEAENLSTQLQFKSEAKAQLEAAADRIKRYQTAMTTFMQLTQERNQLVAELDNLEKVVGVSTAPPEPTLDERQKLAELGYDVQQLKDWLGIQQKMAANDDNVPETCTSCGLKLDCGNCIDEEALNELRSRIGQKENDLRLAQEAIHEKERAVTKFKDEQIRLQSDMTTLQNMIQSKTAVINSHQEVMVSLIDVANKKLENLETTDELTQEIANIQTRINQLNQASRDYHGGKGKLTEVEEFIRRDTALLGTVVKSIEELRAELPHDGPSLSELERRQQEHDELRGQFEQAQKNLASCEHVLSETRKKVAKVKVQETVIEDLRTLKEMLARGGLPRMYVDHKFKILAGITSHYLSVLNSDFSIQPNPDAFLSFLFDRFDGEGQVILPMDKLSGGQKVRLCIAFLLAVQQELVPSVGFQTFDEPSTHLDKEGVDSLVEIFHKLHELLGTSEHQIWICDHHPILQHAFSATLNLGVK